jgi:hypothetical protein
MNLAATLGLYLIGLGSPGLVSPGLVSPGLGSPGLEWLPAHGREVAAVRSSGSSAQQSQDAPASQPQAAPSQSSEPTQATPAPTGQKTNSNQTKPVPARPRRRKKPVPANCSNAPTALNVAVGSAPQPADSTGASSSDANSTNPDSTNAGSTNAATSAGSAPLKPCPPPKKVIRNGGSDQPAVQLTGDTTAEQAVHQRSTDQLTAATNENLKKIVGRQLNPSQQEMVGQIKQFMAQSKTAVAGGDLERGHDLALKAHLLSDELVKP